MSYSIVGLFDSRTDADAAKADLIKLGVPAGDINVKAEMSSATTATASTSTASSATGTASKGIWSDIKDFFTGDDDSHYGEYYAEGSRRGSTLMTANVSEELSERAVDAMHAHNVVDIDNRAAEWSKQGWSGYKAAAATTGTSAAALTTGTTKTATTAVKSTTATTGKTVVADSANPPVALQEVAESLSVGKRQVSRGGVRVVRRVIETPVEESVSLHEERVNVARRTVDRDLTGTELDAAFTDKTIELVETGEEAVKAKTARVTGEVVIDKTGTDRVEKVGDTLRKTEVQVERVPGQTTEKSAVTQTKTVDADSVSSTSTTKKSGVNQ